MLKRQIEIIEVERERADTRKYSKTCLKQTPYITETWTNGK
jgi:hypothetical protein